MAIFFSKLWSRAELVKVCQVCALSLFSISTAPFAEQVSPSASWQNVSIKLADTSVTLQALTSTKTSTGVQGRLLWLPSEYGVLPAEKKLAEQLADYGIESWFVDLYEPLFLSPTPSSVDQIPTEWLAQLIALAQTGVATEQGGEPATAPLWVVAANKAGQLAVRGLHTYQQTSKHHLGLILFNPNLYLNTPEPGEEAQYWPQVTALNLPVSILQAELSPWRWRVSSLAESLTTAGSDVFIHLQPNARDRFYFRPDALPVEQQQTTQLADTMRQILALQLPYLSHGRSSKALQKTEPIEVKETRTTELQPFKGEQGRTLSLKDSNGKTVTLDAYKGKVVLLNFWASWCPPCVHEMPSMARLKTHYTDRYADKNSQKVQGAEPDQAFEILAVNLGENAEDVEAFLNVHPVNFPVLLDEAGIAVKEWKVFAYPSSYLIDKQGQIRLALFGATEWDDASHLEKIDALLDEAVKK